MENRCKFSMARKVSGNQGKISRFQAGWKLELGKENNKNSASKITRLF